MIRTASRLTLPSNTYSTLSSRAISVSFSPVAALHHRVRAITPMCSGSELELRDHLFRHAVAKIFLGRISCEVSKRRTASLFVRQRARWGTQTIAGRHSSCDQDDTVASASIHNVRQGREQLSRRGRKMGPSPLQVP